MNIGLICTDANLWGFGIRILSSSLRAAGHSTRLLFLPADSSHYAPLRKHPLRNATDFFLVDKEFFMRTPDELREFDARCRIRSSSRRGVATPEVAFF